MTILLGPVATLRDRLRRGSTAVAAACLLTSACSPSDLDEPNYGTAAGQNGNSAEESPTAAQRAGGATSAGFLAPRVLGVRYSGALCNEENMPIINGGLFTIQTDRGIGSKSSAASGSCKASIDLAIPSGYTLGGANLCTTVGLDTLNEGVPTADLTITASYPGRTAQPVRKALSGFNESQALCFNFPELFSPTCATIGQESRVTLDVELAAEIPSNTIFHMQTLQGDFTYSAGSIWKSCPRVVASLPGPSPESGPCKGPNNHPCASGLVCANVDPNDPWIPGQCVRPGSVLRPGAVGDVCGSTRRIRCATGLSCMLDGRAIAIDGSTTSGKCMAPIGNEGDTCGGFDGLSCNVGLRCSEARKCVNKPGKAGGESCGAGALKCEAPLVCKTETNVCQRPVTPRAQLGEACGEGAGNGRLCAGFLVCDAQSKRCRESIGLYGEICDNEEGPSCQASLRCSEGRCRTDQGRTGAPCLVEFECKSGVCNKTAGSALGACQ